MGFTRYQLAVGGNYAFDGAEQVLKVGNERAVTILGGWHRLFW
jgi:hypothetical protein